MRTTRTFVAGALVLVATSSHGQGSFRNLDFESARIIPVVGGPYYPYSVAVADAMPGWAVYFGGSQQTLITYNAPALGSTWVVLWATNGQNISGNFSVLLQGGLTASAASISQTGLVPAGSKSLSFEAQPIEAQPGPFLVSLAGQSIPYFPLSTGPNYTLYGADVSAFSGQTVELRFGAVGGVVGGNNWNLDNISFSNLPVPEPGVFGLCALGALLLGWRILGRRR